MASASAPDLEALQAPSSAAMATVAVPAAAAQGVGSSAAADVPTAPIRLRNLQAEYDQERADFDQLASSTPELLTAAVSMLQNGNKFMRQLAARSARDAEAGTLHPASQVEPLTQLDPNEGWSKKRRQPACFGGIGGKRPNRQQQPAPQQQAAAALEPFVKPARKQSSKKGPLIQRLPEYVPKGKGKENTASSAAARHVTPPAQPCPAQPPLSSAAGSCVQLHSVPGSACVAAPGVCDTGMATAAALLPQPGSSAAVGIVMQPAPAQQQAAWPAVQPLNMPQLPQGVPPLGWPSATAAVPAVQPPPALMQLFAALLEQQRTQQLPPGQGL